LSVVVEDFHFQRDFLFAPQKRQQKSAWENEVFHSSALFSLSETMEALKAAWNRQLMLTNIAQ
jgi:hypothetical protein